MMKRSCSTIGTYLFLPLLFAILAHDVAAQTNDGFKVVVNPSNPRSAISSHELSDIFLVKKKLWGDGSPIAPVDLAADSTVREAFSKHVHGRSTKAVLSYWRQQIFAGRSVPPPELSSDAKVIEFVAQNPNAIGYVSASTAAVGVKTIDLDM